MKIIDFRDEFWRIVNFNYCTSEIRIYHALINSVTEIFNMCRDEIYAEFTEEELGLLTDTELVLAVSYRVERELSITFDPPVELGDEEI